MRKFAAVNGLPRSTRQNKRPRRFTPSWRRIVVVTVLSALLLAGGVIAWRAIPVAQAACPTYTVHWGDTLGRIAANYRTTIAQLAQLNHIRNVNLIYVGQRLCVSSGAVPSDPLEWSTPAQVHALLIQAADRHGLPHSLVLAIAWQESNWTQHVIAWDGGIGTMQIMPYTAVYLNGAMHTQLNPYRLWDNIELGTSYLRMLWNTFPTNLQRIISAYNEGARAVITRGIFNWHYVYNVLWYMQRLK